MYIHQTSISRKIMFRRNFIFANDRKFSSGIEQKEIILEMNRILFLSPEHYQNR